MGQSQVRGIGPGFGQCSGNSPRDSSEACRRYQKLVESSPKGSKVCQEFVGSLPKVSEACCELVESLPKVSGSESDASNCLYVVNVRARIYVCQERGTAAAFNDRLQSRGKLHTVVAVSEVVEMRSQQEALFVDFNTDGGRGRAVESTAGRAGSIVGEAYRVLSNEIHKTYRDNCRRRSRRS
ncbi:hypothetical protein BHE74_00010738 [Ensete ventricosum]|nr:hypothetical protein BHE74_00010738 [Ensete ventricosum]